MVNKEMTIAEVIQMNHDLIPFLLDAGMHCLGCPSAQSETLEEACMVHGIESNQLIEKMNAFLLAE